MLFDVVTLDESDLIGVFIEAWHHDSRLFDRVQVLQGRKLREGDRWAVMLGTLLSKNLQKAVGDELVIDGQPLEVIGIFETDSAFENGGALVLIPDLQELMDRHGQVTGFELLLADDSEAAVAATRSAIEGLRQPDGKPWNLAATPAFQQAGRFIFIRMGRAMAWLTSLIAVLIGCIGVLNTMMMSVAERTHEIGVLRAMGWQKSRVLRMVVLEAFVVGLIGAAIGVLAGVILTRLLAKIPAAENVIDGRIAGSILLQGIAVAVIVAVVGSIYPAYRAARQLPTEALRHE
jgi:putative ABC transport system permease protein